MTKALFSLILLLIVTSATVENFDAYSPGKNIKIEFKLIEGKPVYTLIVDGKTPIQHSEL